MGNHIADGWFLMMLLCFFPFDTLAQNGFLSIDCGAKEGYTDSLGISWVTDDDFIFTGQKLDLPVTAPHKTRTTLRYFPENRNKDCYVLPTIPSTTYLIRVMIYYGVDTGTLPLPVKFDITLNSNVWFTVFYAIGDQWLIKPISYESYHYAREDRVYVCLLRASEGVPWISSLEMRAMAPNSYSVASAFFVENYGRDNPGVPAASSYLRYPTDPYDRVWYAPLYDGWARGGIISIINNSTELEEPVSYGRYYNNPPVKVMMDAVESSNITVRGVEMDIDATTFYAILYFHDFRGNPNISASNPCGISVRVNDGPRALYNITPSIPLQAEITWNVTKPGAVASVIIEKQPWSQANPILSAAEYGEVNPLNSSSTDSLEVTALEAVKNSFGLNSWAGDPCFPLPHNWITCDSSHITVLNLSSQQISGSIPKEIGDMFSLQEILLDNNNITGRIPASLKYLPNLRVLAVDNNSLSGGVPYAFQNRTGFSFSGNPSLALCQATDTKCNSEGIEGLSSGKSGKSGSSPGLIVGLIVALALVTALIVFLVRRNKRKSQSLAVGDIDNGSLGIIGQSLWIRKKVSAPGSMSWNTGDALGAGGNTSDRRHLARMLNAYRPAGYIPINEILIATQNYQKKIGAGGYGPVFYGVLANGQEVAVKVNKKGAHQGKEEFVNEVSLLTRVHHNNLVSLIGFCEETNERILVYEYQHNGTLSDLLCGEKPLNWRTRLDIALNAAQGLEYLHTGCYPGIIHRDVKCSNILISKQMVAKVGDFGISKATPESDQTMGGDEQYQTVVKGTPGYWDPEYLDKGCLTAKSDVYSFGIILLEIISGCEHNARLPDDTHFSLINLMRECLKTGDIFRFADSALDRQFNPESMWKVAELALSCVKREGVTRPDMTQVVRSLMEAIDMETPRGAADDDATTFPRDASEQSSILNVLK